MRENGFFLLLDDQLLYSSLQWLSKRQTNSTFANAKAQHEQLNKQHFIFKQTHFNSLCSQPS